MPFEMVALQPHEVLAYRPAFLFVYEQAFAQPPYERSAADSSSFYERLARHAARPGFRCVAARERPGGSVTGFSYGYTSAAGQWWREVVASALTAQQVGEWLDDAFEFVELAVLPEMQGRGAGGALHDALLGGLPHRTAVLSTLAVDTPALRLYRKRGWQVLRSPVHFPHVSKPYQVLGKRLDGSAW